VVYTFIQTPFFIGCFSKAGTLFLDKGLTLGFLNN